MNKKDWYVIIGIILSTAFAAFLINWLLSMEGFIPTEFKKSQWLSFWATYLTGIFALIIGYLAISFGNKNSEKALQQQTEVLRSQENGRIKGEILCRIKKQYEMFNVLEYCSSFYCCDQDDTSALLQRLIDDRARLHKECNAWCLFVPLYLQSPKLAEFVNEYQRCWGESTDILDEFLKLQIQFLQKAKVQDRTIIFKGIYDPTLTIINQKFSTSCNVRDERVPYDTSTYKKELKEQQNIANGTNDEIKRIISQMEIILTYLQKAQDNMEHASTLFLKKINLIDFTRI